MIRTGLLVAVLTLVMMPAGSIRAQEKGDVRFYNLEKEYRTTVTWRYRVRNTKALELKHMVRDMLSIYGVVYVNVQTNELYITDVPEKIADLKEHLPALDVPDMASGDNLMSKVIYLRHATSGDVAKIIQHKLSPEGKLYEVPHLNAVTITDIPSKIDAVVDLMRALDTPVKHISIDVTIVEFSSEKFSRVGVNIFNWLQDLSATGILNYKLSGGDKEKGTGASLRLTSRPRQNPPKLDIHEARFRGEGDLAVGDIVNYLCENGDGVVLANTGVVARNNTKAQIVAREIIPVRFRDPGIYHKDEPTVTAGLHIAFVATAQQDSTINLQITPTFSDLTGWTPEGKPIVFERAVQTEVRVRENAIFVLGGLKKREAVVLRRGIPGLKDIPVLKYLFSVKQTVTVEREVLIFVKPTTDVPKGLHEKKVGEALKRVKKED